MPLLVFSCALDDSDLYSDAVHVCLELSLKILTKSFILQVPGMSIKLSQGHKGTFIIF